MPDPSGNVKSQNGGIAIERPGAGEGFVLRVRYVRAAPLGHPHVVTAEVSCTDDRLATPRTWRVTKDTTGADGAHLRTSAEGNAEVRLGDAGSGAGTGSAADTGHSVSTVDVMLRPTRVE